jgi:hypothetical protein
MEIHLGLLYGRAGRLTAENGGFRPGQYMMPHGVPSAGDWALDRYGAARPLAAILHRRWPPLAAVPYGFTKAILRPLPPPSVDVTAPPRAAGAIYLQGTEGTVIDGCTLERIDGNGVMVRGGARPSPTQIV